MKRLIYAIKTLAYKTYYKFKYIKQDTDVTKIPKNTYYCYDENGVCPYFKTLDNKEPPFNAWCTFCNDNDLWTLWDMCKMCGENEPKDTGE